MLTIDTLQFKTTVHFYHICAPSVFANFWACRMDPFRSEKMQHFFKSFPK